MIWLDCVCRETPSLSMYNYTLCGMSHCMSLAVLIRYYITGLLQGETTPPQKTTSSLSVDMTNVTQGLDRAGFLGHAEWYAL